MVSQYLSLEQERDGRQQSAEEYWDVLEKIRLLDARIADDREAKALREHGKRGKGFRQGIGRLFRSHVAEARHQPEDADRYECGDCFKKFWKQYWELKARYDWLNAKAWRAMNFIERDAEKEAKTLNEMASTMHDTSLAAKGETYADSKTNGGNKPETSASSSKIYGEHAFQGLFGSSSQYDSVLVYLSRRASPAGSVLSLDSTSGSVGSGTPGSVPVGSEELRDPDSLSLAETLVKRPGSNGKLSRSSSRNSSSSLASVTGVEEGIEHVWKKSLGT